MRQWILLTLGLVACPWVGSAEHDRLQAQLLDGADADTDTDSDTDTDTDADADADTDTDTTGCTDDDLEPNDTVADASLVASLPVSIDAALCPGDISSDYGVVADVFEVNIGSGEVLYASILDGFVDDCLDQQILLEVLDSSGTTLLGFDRSDGVTCPTASAGYGPGTYNVLVSNLDGVDARQDYELSLDVVSCGDGDGDGWLDAACGGPDCNDGQEAIGPDETDDPGDLVDRDCDGGDELISTCGPDPLIVNPGIGTLNCGDPRVRPVWDAWSVFVPPFAPVSVRVDNGDGDGDLIAFVIDPDGTSHYGWADGSGNMDDDFGCVITPWSGGGCPHACVLSQPGGAGGFMEIWVAQKDGNGCVEGAEYELAVVVAGSPVTPTPIAGLNDEIIDWPR